MVLVSILQRNRTNKVWMLVVKNLSANAGE